MDVNIKYEARKFLYFSFTLFRFEIYIKKYTWLIHIVYTVFRVFFVFF